MYPELPIFLSGVNCMTDKPRTELSQPFDFTKPELASVFDELSFWSSRFGALLVDNLVIRKHQRILDIGCATGFPLFELAHIHGPTCTLVGVDIWKAALDRARHKRDIYGLTNVELIEADASQLPFPEASFDLIVSNLGINNFADPDAVIKECFRVAADRARIVLTTNLFGHMAEVYQVFRETLVRINKPHYLPKLAEQEHHRLSIDRVTALLESNGFQITHLAQQKFHLRFADGTAMLHHALVKFGFLEGWLSAISPDDEPEVYCEWEEDLNQLAHHAGEINTTIPMLLVEAVKV